MREKGVLIYAGKGSSHSWTWLADLFERSEMLETRFLDKIGFSEHLSDEVRTVIISGGDGNVIANALGRHGFSHLKEFVHSGGTYVGVCAGAYLPLPSSFEPFSWFNISSTRIENIDCATQLDSTVSPREAVRYGNCSIVHPVRGELGLEMGNKRLRAPIFGGPIFKEPTDDEVIARYRGELGSAELQMDRTRAVSMIAGKPAIIRARHGHGELLLLGPHLEHPRYPESNRMFLQLIRPEASSARSGKARRKEEFGDKFLARAIADLKVAILGLENRSFLVGNKLWDGARFLELLNAIEGRYHTADSNLAEDLTGRLHRVRAEILKSNPESLLYADEGPELLVEVARLVVDNHFKVLRKSRNR